MKSSWHLPDFSLQSIPTEKTPDVGLNPDGCPLPLLLHKPFLSSLAGSIDEPCSRGLGNGEHVCKLAQTLKGKWRVAGVDHYMKNIHRKGLKSKGWAGMWAAAESYSRLSSTFQSANSSPGTSPNFLSALFMQLPRAAMLFPVLSNYIFLREKVQRVA